MKYAFMLAVVLLSGCTLLFGPDVGPPSDLKVEPTPERLARGEYLVNNVAACVDCHSQRDWSRLSGPVKPGTVGMGGQVFSEDEGLPGNIYAKNITPHALANWSDGEILRAMTAGVSKDGHALFPVMPYPNYAQLTEDDAQAIIAYIRTLAPVESTIPARTLNFPVNFIVNTIPKPARFTQSLDPSDTVVYGKYLLTVASCGDCHTPITDRGERIAELTLAGGMKFKTPGGVVRSANITPDEQTGIGSMTRDAFIARFKHWQSPAALAPTQPGEFNTAMPWALYAGMTTSDLGAIYDYLRTVKPVKNSVEKFSVVAAK